MSRAHALPAVLERALHELVPAADPMPPPIGAAEHLARLDALRRRMDAAGLDALLVGAGP